MQEILFQYELKPTTWAYLSALLTLGIFFKFHRFWSVRNLDLLGLIAFSPGLLSVFYGLEKIEQGDVQTGQGLTQFGYAWLFVVGGLFVLRLFMDPVMVRRPMLEPNLNASGLTFTGAALLVFLAANVLANKPPDRLEHVLPTQETALARSPGYAPFHHLATFCNTISEAREKERVYWEYPPSWAQIAVARTVAITAILALVFGIVAVGYRHFDSIQMGVAAASLYLLLPYAGQMTGRIDHVIPAALLVWAVAAYRRPLPAGILLGLAGGLVFYPLFLFPLWLGFYWRRGLTRYLIGTAFSLALLLVLLIFVFSENFEAFRAQWRQMLGGTLLSQDCSSGFWRDYSWRDYGWAVRIPVLAVFAVICGGLGLWPPQKNLGTLLSCSAAVMLGSQFCIAYEGGLFMAWYLPLLVLTILRPNLEDRVASSAVIEGRTTWVARLLYRLRKK